MYSSLITTTIGYLLVSVTALVVVGTWTDADVFRQISIWLMVPLAALLALQVGWGRRIYLMVGVLLVAAAIATRSDWSEMLDSAFARTGFIIAFFTALATLRNASASSAAIGVCGKFLAEQPPGRRYAALTVGGQLFALLLNYGSIVLLGSMAEQNAKNEPDPERRAHRTRRMLLAIQRGFLSTLPWSPMAFATAVTLSIVPGAKWSEALPYCLVTGAMLAGIGWALDTIFKPKVKNPATSWGSGDRGWFSLWPLLLLLALLGIIAGGLHFMSGISVPGVVMLVVPVIALLWVGLQNRGGGPLAAALKRANGFTTLDLPNYRSEIVLLMMAGFIGTLGSNLAAPYVAASGIDVRVLPGWLILVIIVWVIQVTGQLGMNPILSVSLLAPLLPEASAMGLDTVDVVCAITSGWALSGASSPFTATTVLIGSMGHVSAHHVGWKWNGWYTLTCGVAISVWVALLAMF